MTFMMNLLPIRGIAAVGVLASVGVAAPARAAVQEVYAPDRIHVGSPYTEIANTEVVADEADDLWFMSLQQPGYGAIDSGSFRKYGPGDWLATVGFDDSSIKRYGAWSWRISGYDFTASTPTEIEEDYAVDVRAHSMTGLAKPTRNGSTVHLTGAVRVYNNTLSRYQGWPVRVYIQRKGANGSWSTIGAGRPDWRGNLNTTVKVARGVTLRLLTSDTGTAWGAASSARGV